MISLKQYTFLYLLHKYFILVNYLYVYARYHKLRVLFVWANVKAETTGLGPPEKEGLGPLPVPNP